MLKYTTDELAADLALRCKKAKKTAQGWLACCPAHDDRHPSLSILPGTARVALYCFAGCDEAAIAAQFGMTRDDLAVSAPHRSLPSSGPRVPSPKTPKAPKAIPDAPEKRARLKQMWHQARPITPGDPVGRYLTRRGLWHDPIPGSLRYHPRLPYHHEGKTFTYHPALIALIQAPDKTPVGMHRIYLAANGEKAVVPSPKKLYIAAPWDGAAVRLGRAGATLIITEGIETGLAVRKSTLLPSWSAISEGGMRKVVVPDAVELVIIAADNDVSGVGQQAARTLAERLRREGKRVKICIPETPGSDWADGVQEVYGG